MGYPSETTLEHVAMDKACIRGFHKDNIQHLEAHTRTKTREYQYPFSITTAKAGRLSKRIASTRKLSARSGRQAVALANNRRQRVECPVYSIGVSPLQKVAVRLRCPSSRRLLCFTIEIAEIRTSYMKVPDIISAEIETPAFDREWATTDRDIIVYSWEVENG